VQCVTKHVVERHLAYMVCMKNVSEQCVIKHGVERHMSYVVCVENAGSGARYFHRAWCGASPAICCV